MLQTDTQVLDYSPRGLADSLDPLVRAVLDQDGEVAGILKAARDSLNALAWTRHAHQVNAGSKRRDFRRRHKARRVLA